MSATHGMPDLVLSIVSHGHGPLLARLLDDLAGLPNLDQAKVIVTLNITEPGFDATRWPTLDLLVVRNATPKGFGANHNAAFFEHCRSNWFAVLNPDLRLYEDPFACLMEKASADPTCGLAAPAIVNSAGDLEDSVQAALTPVSLAHRALMRLAGRTRLPGFEPSSAGHCLFWVAGMFMLFPSEAFREVGGFDERFFLYCEDFDICARLRHAGRSIVLVSQSVAVHDAQRDSRRLSRHLYWHATRLLRVWFSSAFWWVVLHGSASATQRR